MSHENVEVVRLGLDAYRRRDVEAMCELSHEDVELYTLTEGVAEAEPFRGHHGIAQWIDEELQPWDEFRLEPTEIREVGDRVLVRARVTARGRGSSIELSADSGLLFDLRQGKLARARSYLNWSDALKAVGLRE